MYRAFLLCACLLLVASPGAFSASPLSRNVDAAKAAAAPVATASHSLDAARQAEKQQQAAPTSNGAAEAAKSSLSASVSAASLPAAAATAPNNAAKTAAAVAPAAAAPSAAAGQKEQAVSSNAPTQQHQQPTQQQKPAASPTVTQPAAPKPVDAAAGQPSAAAQPKPQEPAAAGTSPAQISQQETQVQPQQLQPDTVIVEAELLSSNEEAAAEEEEEDLTASLMSSDSGALRYYTRRSGVQPPNHDYDSHHVLLKQGYSPGSKPSSHSYTSKDPSHSYHDSHTSGRSYSESHPPGKPGSYHGPEHDKYDHRYDVKGDHKYDDKYAHIHEEKRDDVVNHHTGKAAKKAIKAMEKEKESESKYMSDHNRDSYSRSSYSTHRPDSAHRYSENEDAVTLEVPMQQDSLATGLQQAAVPSMDKDTEKMLKLQKYYQAEADMLAAELEGDSVSSFARPSKYSNKAAKYAAMALKAQGIKAKPTAGVPAAQVEAKPGLAGLAAAFMKKKPTFDKTAVLSVPKPTIKGIVSSEDPLGEEISYEEYMANPQLYAGIAFEDTQEPVKAVTHEQLHKGGKERKLSKKAQAQAQKQANINMMNGAASPYAAVPNAAVPNAAVPNAAVPNAAVPNGAAQLQGHPSGPEYHQDGPSRIHYYPDPRYVAMSAPSEFDMDTNYQPHLRRKEAKNVYNFRSVPGTESSTLGYTKGSTDSAFSSSDRPVVVSYTSKLTCGNGPSIGTCTGTGIMPSPNPATQSTMMSFTCTIDADASNICGLKYIQGMTVTAQGLVTTTIDPTDPDTLSSLSADVLPITGIYVPGRRTTLLADVVTLLSGVKGGSLMLRSDGNSDGHFSFYFWR